MTKITNLEKHYRKMQIPLSPHISNEVEAEHERVRQEESTKRCFIICIRAMTYIDRLQSNLSEELFRNKIKKLQINLAPGISDNLDSKREQLQEEKEITEQCLTTCTTALEYIRQLQSSLSEDYSRGIINTPRRLLSSHQLTASTLQECKDIFINTIIDLEKHAQDITSKLQALSEDGMGPDQYL